MKTKNFNEIFTQSENECTNTQALAQSVKGARKEIKSLSHLYFVNQLNKLAKKNEFLQGVNLNEFGKMLQSVTSEKDLFTLKCFEKDLFGVPSYVKTRKVKKSGAFMIDETITERKQVKPSLTGLLSAYRDILAPVAKEQDKALSDITRKARTEARKALRLEQDQARNDYMTGKIDINEFSRIMLKAV